MEIILKSYHKDWYQSEKGYSIGYAFIKEKLLNEQQLCSYLYDKIEQNSLSESLRELNGSFAAVIRYKDNYYLIVDKIRSYPILYVKKHDGYKILNDASKIFEDKNIFKEVHEQSLTEFLAKGYLSGTKTLLRDVFQVEAGSFVKINNLNFNIFNYHNFKREKKAYNSDQDVYIIANKQLEYSFKRIIESIGEKQIVIPLSGGYDSRLIACLCKKNGCKNVICFSYGRHDSFEVEISKKVAMQLGFKWYFIEYTNELLEMYFKSDEWIKYFNLSHSFVTVPHFQDFFAVAELNRRSIIDCDAVFMPGHSGDLLGGSKLPIEVFNSSFYSNIQNLSVLIYEHFFDLNREKYNLRDDCIQVIRSSLGNIQVDSIDCLLDEYEPYWFVKSKIANFLVNSMRVYEYFGYNWRLPLWDDDFASFWYTIEWKEKMNSKMYNQFMFEFYFKPLGVDYVKKSQHSPSLFKRIVPSSIITFIRRLYIYLHPDDYNFNSQDAMIEQFKLLDGGNNVYDMKYANDINSVAVLCFLNQFMYKIEN